MQTVTYGKTISGQPGLFTNGYLAWPLSPEQLEAFKRDPVAYCERLGFQYQKRQHETTS